MRDMRIAASSCAWATLSSPRARWACCRDHDRNPEIVLGCVSWENNSALMPGAAGVTGVKRQGQNQTGPLFVQGGVGLHTTRSCAGMALQGDPSRSIVILNGRVAKCSGAWCPLFARTSLVPAVRWICRILCSLHSNGRRLRCVLRQCASPCAHTGCTGLGGQLFRSFEHQPLSMQASSKSIVSQQWA